MHILSDSFSKFLKYIRVFFIFKIVIFIPTSAFSLETNISPVINADKSIQEKIEKILKYPPQAITGDIPISSPKIDIPEGADKIELHLSKVDVEGVTVFKPEELEAIYSSSIGKEIKLSTLWEFANEITQKYRNSGYFLSRAYIPQQNIKKGIIKINVIEGYISKVNLPENLAENKIVKAYINPILIQKPSNIKTVESAVLRLNDIPGYRFRAVISKPEATKPSDGDVELNLIPESSKIRGIVSIDNASSRYTGPQSGIVSMTASLIPFNQTTISGLVSIPIDYLTYESIDHYMLIAPNTRLGASFNATYSHPKYTLKAYDIKTASYTSSIYTQHQWITSRHTRLSTKFSFDSINQNTDIFGNALTRDRIRVLRSKISFDTQDKWRGENNIDFTLSRGIDGWGSSNNNDLLASKREAKPAFSKAELNLSRLQTINNNWSVFSNSASQIASKTMYSNEQFGYGGQVFGRAYDSSGIVGDQGIATSLEVRYEGLQYKEKLAFQPYSFYDVGKVWNHSKSAVKHISGASAGFGIRLFSHLGQQGDIGIAWPLTKDVVTPIYGADPRDPRINFLFTQRF